jgi:hypothetical protein
MAISAIFYLAIAEDLPLTLWVIGSSFDKVADTTAKQYQGWIRSSTPYFDFTWGLNTLLNWLFVLRALLR